MADPPGASAESFDSWLETVTVQYDSRRLIAQISVRTLKGVSGAKEHHVKLISDDDDCFLYRTTVNLDEYRRLVVSNSFMPSFDNLPQYVRQLLRAAKQENEYGQSYFINIISSGTLGIASRIELLITTRSAGYTTQTRVLSLPMASASDAEFKEYLTLKFEKMKKEKDQLRRSASFLESQLRREKARSREMEDKNHWLRKELKFTQNLLKSAESIQKHYEVILSLRHRGETGSTVVTIGDSSGSQGAAFAEPHPIDIPSDSMIPSTSGYTGSDSYGVSPVLRKTSTYSQTSDDDRRGTKRKVSFCHTTDTDSDSDEESGEPEAKHERKNPPPRKFAAAILQCDDKLMEIRKQEERKRSERMSDEDEGPPKTESSDQMMEWSTVPRKVARVETGTMDSEDQQSHLLPSPLVPRALSPPSVLSPVKQEPGRGVQNCQSSNRIQSNTLPSVVIPKDSAKEPGHTYMDTAHDDCPSDAN